MRYIQSEKTIFTGKKVSVTQCQMDFGNGKTPVYERIDFDTRTGISVLPLTETGVKLIRHYQLGLDQELWSLPTGGLEAHEDPKQRAIWELEEEAGVTSEDVQLLFRTHQLPGYIGSEPGYIFAAKQLRTKQRDGDEPFPITVTDFTWETALSMIQDGTIIDGRTIMTLLYYDRFYRSI